MINWEYADLFNGSHDKQWEFLEMADQGIFITNEDIVSESITFERGMCESDLFEYGTYSSACLKVSVFRTDERFVGKRFNVFIRIENHDLKVGEFTCYSDKLSSDHRSRELVMYDDLYKLNELDVAQWYNHYWDDNDDVTLIQFRFAFFEDCLGIECEGYDTQGTTLANDFVVIKKAANFRTLSASTVLKSILQVNCVNACMSNLNTLKWVRIKEYYIHGAPPQPLVFDIVPDITLDTSKFYDCYYEEYQVWNADSVGIIIDPDNKILHVDGGTSPLPSHDNFLYISYDNMFFRDLDMDGLHPFINSTLYGRVHNRIAFTPAQIQLRGNLCYEPGDVVEVDIDGKTIYTVIIKQTITGVQGLTMTLSCQGDEYFSNPLSVESDSYDDYAGSGSIGVKYTPITLLASEWNSTTKQQTVQMNGIDADETSQLIQPVPRISSIDDFVSAQILCIGQAYNSLTFLCTSIPEDDIDLFIVTQPVSLSALAPIVPEEEDDT